VPRVEWRLAKTKVAGSNPVFRSNVLKARSLFFAIVGGLHLFEADDARVDWTASELKRLRIAHLVGAHCTGIEALMRLRQGVGLTRRTAVVGAVGASFDLETGIDPRDIAR